MRLRFKVAPNTLTSKYRFPYAIYHIEGMFDSEYRDIETAKKECSRLNRLPSYLHPAKKGQTHA